MQLARPAFLRGTPVPSSPRPLPRRSAVLDAPSTARVTSADALPTCQPACQLPAFSSSFSARPCCAEGGPCNCFARPGRWCHDPSGQPPTSHPPPSMILSVYSGQADVHSCTLCLPSLSCPHPLLCLAGLG